MRVKYVARLAVDEIKRRQLGERQTGDMPTFLCHVVEFWLAGFWYSLDNARTKEACSCSSVLPHHPVVASARATCDRCASTILDLSSSFHLILEAP